MIANAVIFGAPNTVEFGQVRCPDPGPGDVVVQITHSWISNGTEGSFLRGERIAGDTPYRSGDPWPFPIVPGYQKVGLVEWVGDEIQDVTVGETVFAAMGKVESMYAPFGGHVSPSVSPREQIWVLPEGIDPVAFSGLVLTQVGYNCGTRAEIGVGGSAVVVGDGLVGQWSAQTLVWRGAEVVLVGHHGDRLDKFARMPNRRTLLATDDDWAQQLREMLPKGVDVAVDTVGSIAAVEALLPLMVKYGHVVSAGFYGTDDRLALQPLRDRELSVDLVSGWSKERMDRTRALIASGHLETIPLITHRYPAERAPEAWRLIVEKSEQVLGVILDWS
jgi:2-desacetyl-2-hydroxyethyl bacteriochlorophyllide A dehydrogenase